MAAESFVNELPLVTAAELRSNAEVTPLEQDRLALRACLINASNTGATSIIWNKPLRPELKQELEDAGYVVNPNPLAARPTDQWIIEAL